MKTRRIISIIVTLAVIMTNAAITGLSTVYAETVNTATSYSENFDGYSSDVNYQNTLLGLKDYGWYMADNDTLYDNVTTVAPYSTYSYKLARIGSKDGSRCMQVVSAGEQNSTSDSNIPDFGYGKTFPGVSVGGAATGSWEINFDFQPALINKKTQFSFTLNTGDGSASGTNARHNIISGYGQRFYLGHRDYNWLLNSGVRQGELKASEIGGVMWYRVKTILNCDAGYYSVELYNRSTGALIARRSPISFNANETIGFLKFSALGYSQNSYVYVDNISIEKIAKNSSIYNETFDTFTNGSYAAATGMTTGAETEDLNYSSYFEGHTPWRFYTGIGNSYGLEDDIELSSQVVRLGDKPETSGDTEASGLVYMPSGETLVTQTTEPLRGMLKTSFKIKPETIADDFTVNAIPSVSDDMTSDSFAYFRIKDLNGTPQFVKANGDYVALNASSWYDVDLVFDVVGRTVTATVKDTAGNAVASLR